MNDKNLHRLYIEFLCILIFIMISTPVYATETPLNNVVRKSTDGTSEWYSTLSTATAAAVDGDVIEVYNSFTETVSVQIKTQNLTIKAADGYNPIISWTNTTEITIGDYTKYNCVVIYTSVNTSTTFGGGTGTLTLDASLASDDDNKGKRARVIAHCGKNNVLNLCDGIIVMGGRPGGGNYEDIKNDNYKPEGTGEIVGMTGSGAGLLMYYGTLNMYGGIIRDNYSLWGSSSTHNFVGGGGGICLCTDTTFNFSGGLITHNAAGSGGGGGVLVGTGATLVQTGGTISENVCNFASGGGIGVNAGYKEVVIEGGNIISNIVTGHGGGIFARGDGEPLRLKGGNISNNSAGGNGGGILFWTVGTASATNKLIVDGTVSIDNNTASLGGGISIGRESASTGKKCYLEIGGNSSIKNNVANDAGGGLYVQSDGEGNYVNDVKILDGIIANNKAPEGAGVYVAGGTFTMSDGIIESNTATESGGGIQISDGNVYIISGKIASNVARGENSDAGYGGGIFVDGGEIVSITGGEISSNVAAKNGGGIEIKTDKEVTVDVFSGSFIDNVADECGGAIGIDCDNGIINVGDKNCDGSLTSSHIHPVLSDNLAGVQGGGFYMTGANAILNIYCGLVDNNIVVRIENNFDQSSGIVTVYEGVQIGEKNEGIIVVGGTFVDKRTSNEEKFQVIYYSNFEGSTEYKEALITNGSTITLPGDIFGVADYEIIGWTTDINNTTEVEYEAGYQLEITGDITLYALWVLEEENEPTFMVIIPTEIKLKNQNVITSFDINTTLNLFPRDKVLRINLLREDTTLNLIHDEIVVEQLEYRITKNGQEIEEGDVVSEFYSESTLITYNETEKFEIEVIDTPKYAGNYEVLFTFLVSIDNIS